jgi:ribosomal protein S18 acetylase RimI-like enzyme
MLGEVELSPLDWGEYLEYLWSVGAPIGLLGGADASAFQTLVARLAGENVATAIAFDHDGDCGVFNMSTREAARRRGLGTALTARHVHDAAERGLLDREPAVHRDGRAGLRRGWLPRPRPHPRVRPAARPA